MSSKMYIDGTTEHDLTTTSCVPSYTTSFQKAAAVSEQRKQYKAKPSYKREWVTYKDPNKHMFCTIY